MMHAYRTHTCGALRAADAGHEARLSGWVHAKRDHGGLKFVDLRDHYGMTQCVFPAGSPAFDAVDTVRPESVITVTGQVVPREPGTVNPKLPTGEVELRAADLVRAVRRRGAADPGRRRREIPRGSAAEIPLPRPAARQAAPEHHAARRGDRLDPPADDRGRLHRVPDPDPDRRQPGGRARLPGAGAAASRQVLRAAAGAAAVQAARHGGRLRPLLPDRALLPRRGLPRRPLARASSTSSISR